MSQATIFNQLVLAHLHRLTSASAPCDQPMIIGNLKEGAKLTPEAKQLFVGRLNHCLEADRRPIRVSKMVLQNNRWCTVQRPA